MMGLKKQDHQLQVVPVTNQTASIETLQDLRGFLEEDEDISVSSKRDQMIMHNNNNNNNNSLGTWDLTGSSWEVDEADNNTTFMNNLNNNNSNNNVGEERNRNLKLNLNHEQVFEAWSNRGSLWAYNHHHHHPCSSSSSSSASSKYPYLGEVPNLEDERTSRESSVLRYKKKRLTRLFANKIRYQVRKKNADNRPRHKGRFVKLASNDE